MSVALVSYAVPIFALLVTFAVFSFGAIYGLIATPGGGSNGAGAAALGWMGVAISISVGLIIILISPPSVSPSACHPVVCGAGFGAATYLARVGLIIIGVWVIIIGWLAAIIGGATTGNISRALRRLRPVPLVSSPPPQSA